MVNARGPDRKGSHGASRGVYTKAHEASMDPGVARGANISPCIFAKLQVSLFVSPRADRFEGVNCKLPSLALARSLRSTNDVARESVPTGRN